LVTSCLALLAALIGSIFFFKSSRRSSKSSDNISSDQVLQDLSSKVDRIEGEWNEVYTRIRRANAAAHAREMRAAQREETIGSPEGNGDMAGMDPRDQIAAQFNR
jgi:outer membrane murein-binding lipoprotein Lpp